VFPLRGQVPSGSTLVSGDDSTLRSSIIATHTDGSASVMVVAGTATLTPGQTKTLMLQSAKVSGEAALNSAAIQSAVTSVSVAFGTPFGTALISDFSSPERIWWANASTICARYRAQPATPGKTSLEIVVDIHVYSNGSAQIEVVVENGKMNTTSPTKPAVAAYLSAVVSVNGTAIATVDSTKAVAGEAGHYPFRAWYASTWIGGNPGIRATQPVTDLQKHPLLFKVDQAGSKDLSSFANDAYSPFGNVRQAANGMGGAGDNAWIGPLPYWDATFLQTGDVRAANSVEQNAIAVLSFNVNYRDATTGLLPTITALAGKSQQSNWPNTTNNDDGHGGVLGWEVAHAPAAGLMAFMCRPSPVYIEIAQKIAVWTATWSTFQDSGYTTTGVFGQYYQIRGRAWSIRNLAHAAMLTPDSQPWKSEALTSLAANFAYLDGYRTSPLSKLNVTWDGDPTHPVSTAYTLGGFYNEAGWMADYLVTETHKATSAQLLSGAAQTAADVTADWLAAFRVRWVNEQTDGGWRYIPYITAYGSSQTMMSQYSSWSVMRAATLTDTAPGSSGPFESSHTGPSRYADYTPDGPAGAYYPSYFWSALVAATERGVTGAHAAWATVQANVTNLATWRAGFAADPRWGSAPRSI
jgi:hypothetical protein